MKSLAVGASFAALVLPLLVPRLAFAQCQGRPTDPGGVDGYSFGSATVKTYDTPQARVHYATSGEHAPEQTSTRADGVPDTVVIAADTAEDALTRYAAMGYRKPPSDASCTSNGGDERLDIYLVGFAGADGTTVPDACDGNACGSYVLCEATFKGRAYATPTEGFQTVITHELFHAVQNAYDAGLDRFWAEGTAQWAMKKLHPDLADFERQLPAFFAEPNRSLDTQPSGVTAGYLYGSAVWPLFLSTKFDDDTIRTILETEADGTKSLLATDAVLATKGTSLAEAFPLFAAWNVATKTYAGSGGYPDAASYPGVKVTELADGAAGITSGLAYFPYLVSLDAASKISLETDATRNVGLVVPLEGGKAKLDAATKLPANVEGEALVIVAGITTKKTDAPFTVHIGAADPELPAPEETMPSAEPGWASNDGGCDVSRASRRESGLVGLTLAALGLVATRRRRSSG